jgi:hypothetical protein
MKEELTTKMHSEFKVSAETDTKHRVFTLLTLTGTEDKRLMKKWLSLYDVTFNQVTKYLEEFISLGKKNK